MKSFAIIGLGLFGSHLAKTLFNDGYNVLVIDQNEKLIDQIADEVTRAVIMDAKDRKALQQLGINKYDCVIVAVSGDLATSVLVTMNLKALNVPMIICKVQNNTDQEVLETLGASSCIIPEHIGATKLAKTLEDKHVLDYIQLSDDHSIIEFSTPTSWIGHSVIELGIRSKYNVNIICIKNDGAIHVDFDPAVSLTENDELVVIGRNSDLDKLHKIK